MLPLKLTQDNNNNNNSNNINNNNNNNNNKKKKKKKKKKKNEEEVKKKKNGFQTPLVGNTSPPEIAFNPTAKPIFNDPPVKRYRLCCGCNGAILTSMSCFSLATLPNPAALCDVLFVNLLKSLSSSCCLPPHTHQQDLCFSFSQCLRLIYFHSTHFNSVSGTGCNNTRAHAHTQNASTPGGLQNRWRIRLSASHALRPPEAASNLTRGLTAPSIRQLSARRLMATAR